MTRSIASLLYFLTRVAVWVFLLIGLYALVILLFATRTSASSLPIAFNSGDFVIYYPFTTTPFLLGEDTAEFLVFNFCTLAFYTLFLWVLGNVFQAIKQPRLFTKKGVVQLSRFYMINLIIPILLLVLLAIWRQEISNMVQITFLHLIIGVFAFFMASIFKQGLILQEEQDLIF